jgi:hypothetical protein
MTIPIDEDGMFCNGDLDRAIAAMQSVKDVGKWSVPMEVLQAMVATLGPIVANRCWIEAWNTCDTISKGRTARAIVKSAEKERAACLELVQAIGRKRTSDRATARAIAQAIVDRGEPPAGKNKRVVKRKT